MLKSHATCRPESRCQSDLSTISVLANRSLHQDLMHSGCRGTAVPNVCLQAFSLFALPGSPLYQRPVHRLRGQKPNCIHCILSLVWSESTLASGRWCLVTKFTSGLKRRRFNLKETCSNFVSFNGFLLKKFRPMKLFLLSDHFPNLLFLFVLKWYFFPLMLGKNKTSW